MNTFTTKDGTEIFFKDWGNRPRRNLLAWPGPAQLRCLGRTDAFLGQQGYRVVAHDRRGHGRSGQTWDGNNMDRYADDLAELIEHLDLKEITMVGHSTGGGEVVRYFRPAWQQARQEGRSDRSRASTDVEDRQEPRWASHVCF